MDGWMDDGYPLVIKRGWPEHHRTKWGMGTQLAMELITRGY
jgi:hypothetical protein